MSIRRKLFFLLTAVVVVFGLSLLAVWQLESGRLDAIEKARIRERSESLDRFLKLWEVSLESFVTTAAGAPSFVDAITDGDRATLESQIPEDTAAKNRVGAFWICRVDGSLVYSRNRLYADRLDELPVPRNSIATLFKDGVTSAHFFVKVPAGVLEVLGRQVAAAAARSGKADPAGYFFAGRLWNDDELKEMSLFTGNTLRLVETTYQERQLVLPSGEVAFTRPLNSWDGTPVARLLARNDSPLLRHVDRLRAAVWFLVFAFAASMTFVVAYAVKWWVFKPLRNLVQSLRTEAPGGLKGWDRERGEVGEIARLIWTFFEQRESLIKELSERRQIERDLRTHEHQSLTTQNIESIGRLAGGVAHDFNNLLTTIIGYTGILQERFRGDESAQDDLGKIMTAADQATVLTRQLLAFSRRQVLHPRLVNLNELLEENEPQLLKLVGDRLETRINADASQGFVRADPDQLKQVLIHLVANARDAMPDGGILTISTANTLVPERTRHQGLELPAGRYVTLEVSDTGVGMDEQTKERMFEPFFTTKTGGKGNGLGLAMVYGVVQQSGGAIAVSSSPGAGTTFLVHLPSAETKPIQDDVGADARMRPNPKRRDEIALVLIADTGVLSLVNTVLGEQGFRVLTASDGAAALATARNEHAEIRLMICDLVLPEGSALTIAEQIKAEHRETEILYLGGVGDEIDHALRLASQLDILEKPFTPSELTDRVCNILRGRIAR